MSYNRNAAISFAKRHFNREADDGIFLRTDGAVNVAQKRKEKNAPAPRWNFRFVPDGMGAEHAVFQDTTRALPDKSVQEWPGLADCAHFLTRCLRAGGLTGVGSNGVPQVVAQLQALPTTKTVAQKVTRSQGQNILESGVILSGDVIAYFNTDPKGDYNLIDYTHSAMLVPKISNTGTAWCVTCHTMCRFPGLTLRPITDDWHLDHSNYAYTFIHFADDDASLSPLAPMYSGWWRIEGAAIVYQHISPNGTAALTKTKPASANTVPSSIEKAYWFADSSQVGGAVFIWKPTGTVDLWQPSLPQSPHQFDIMTSGMPRRKAFRIK